MKMSPFLTKSILLLSLIVVGANDSLCPNKCVCRRMNQRDEIKLRCGEADKKINHLEEIDLLNIANEIVQFNLSNNFLTTFFPKVQLIALQKLDLSRNRLTVLQNNQFSELPNLRRLDISSNSIKNIELLAFAKLSNLERLKLNQNQISTVGLGTFDPLVSLKQLDISSNPLTCDCSLLWLLDWSQKESVKLVSNPTCNTPSPFKGLLLRKLKIGVDINCKSPALNKGFPIIEMKPNANQVVFEGDTLNLQCTAPSISDTYDSPMSSKIEWTWLDSDPKLYFSDITIESHFLQSNGLVASTLRISKLKRNHTGIWNCLLISMQGNHSKGITIVVISDDTEYCPITVSSNNKGTYTWPRTVVNYTATIPCESLNLSYDVSLQKASYFCSEDGQWENLNTSMCSYTSDTTKILEQFSKVNSSLVESAKHFRNYTSTSEHFKDVMDLVFAVATMENYLKYLTVNQIGGVLMDVTNNLLELPKAYLREASYRHQSCMKLINITEQLAGTSSTSLLHKSNIATEIFPVQRNGFSSLKCTWYVDAEKSTDRLFYCVTNSQSETTELPGKITEASITIPETLFQQLEDQDHHLPDQVYSILVAMYSSNKLFPIDEARAGKEDVTTAVVGAKLVNITVTNLTDPVFILLKTPHLDALENTLSVPVWWDPHLNNGSGTWSSEGCHFSHEDADHTVFFCHNFGYYGLLQDVTNLQNNFPGARFKLSHPAIYIVGMLLHYFTLSSLLWMCVGVNCMYKRLSKNDVMELQDDELPSDQPIKKPILGLYFVGWGVAIIVCGISAAINIKEYASQDYCFLRVGPPLSALYIPFAILVIFLGIFFLLIRCAIYGLDANGHLSEGTQATENVDLDLLEPNFPNPDSRSVLSASSKTASSEVEDPEHAPSAQLKAHMIFLCIYTLTWASCAFATVEPYRFVSFETDMFSIAYAVLSTVLSAFTIFFYCVARSDVRGQWILFGRCLRRKQICFRSRNVSDTAQNVPHIQIQPLPMPPVGNSAVGDLQITSRSSSRSSSRTKSNSHNSNILKGAVDLNGPSYSEAHGGAKINNVNLIVLHRQQYRTSVIPNIIENPTSAAEVFYNPHQSIVARKFFKRQKRHMMKRNNLVPRQRDSDSASVLSDFKKAKDNSSMDQSIFGTNSKVNNTNIHVEHVHKKQQKNPNIFSDSADDYDCANVPVQNIVLNAERLRRREMSKNKSRKKCNTIHHVQSVENNMRSVSQQCTLEYSSENISDSILDKTSPDKGQDVDEIVKLEYNPVDILTDREPTCDEAKQGEMGSLLPEPNPSEISLSVVGSQTSEMNETVPRIFVNPSHDLHLRKGVQSRASSVSVSDLDELYQQIRRGPRDGAARPRSFVNNFSLTRNSPCFSDSDINSYVTDNVYKQQTYLSNSHLSDNVETTV
ncbi:adhesion G protein-coupled receptor A3 isoform X2 [Tenebrio molitor]|uniref:adhesion G protein-coupled receptor A3 isoform X2 n=1 Tax=Tenebrio molitor TaxID=7067 RepID=UPI0036248457